MATLQDRRNPSHKARVTADGEQIVRGSNSDGSISITDTSDESSITDNISTVNVTYICTAPVGTLSSAAAWKIKLIDVSSGFMIIKYANGSDSYTNIADNRTILSYS